VAGLALDVANGAADGAGLSVALRMVLSMEGMRAGQNSHVRVGYFPPNTASMGRLRAGACATLRSLWLKLSLGR